MPVSGENFTDTMEISTPFLASGQIGKEYEKEITRMYVGLVQIEKSKAPSKNGNPDKRDITVTVGAYGMGYPLLNAGTDSKSMTWSMQLTQDTGEINQPNADRQFKHEKRRSGSCSSSCLAAA